MNIGAVHKPITEIRNSKDSSFCSPIQNLLAMLRILDDIPGLASLYIHFEIQKKERHMNSRQFEHLVPDLSNGHAGGGDVLPENRLNPLYERLKDQEQEIEKLKTDMAEAAKLAKEQHKKMRLDMTMIEDRLNYRPCCSIM